MKRFELDLQINLFKKFDSIRNKKDIILLLLETIKLWILNEEKIKEFDDFAIIDNEEDLKVVIYIDKMRRIFLCTKNKVQSFCFPFIVMDNNHTIEFRYKYIKFNCALISVLKSVFENTPMDNAINLVDTLLDDDGYKSVNKEEQEILEDLVMFLLSFEDGYLRFDFSDEENYKEKYHPRHHIDLYYTNCNTFKLGLSDVLPMKRNIEIIDINQKCFTIM